ncbi:DLH domain-containing protein [Citrus sinensis]|nr:DLH domain-containing protein [Citrus sinensis]
MRCTFLTLYEMRSTFLNFIAPDDSLHQIIRNTSGPQCCANPPTLNPTAGGGHVENLGGLNAYVNGSPHSKLAVLLVSDVYDANRGFTDGFDNDLGLAVLKLADKIAAAGFYVAVPDFLHGDPYVPNAGRTLQDWIKDHGTDKAFEEAKPVIHAIKSKGITAIGAAGFCWGAKVAVQLAKREFIQAAVLLHPSFVTVDDIKAVEVPTAVLGAEFDQISPPDLLKQFEEVLTAKSEVDGYVKIFPKVSHGWTVRYNVEDKSAVKCAEEAHQDMLEWFAKYVN